MEEIQILRVNTTVDENDGSADVGTGLSLRDAVIIANSTSGDEIIELEGGTVYQLTIEGEEGASGNEAASVGDLDVIDNIGSLTIRSLEDNATIDANGIDRVFQVGGEGLTLENITVTGGIASSPGEIATSGESNGGGILVDIASSLTLTNSTVTDNQASGDGGGISASGEIVLENSTITNNNADGDGGGISNILNITTITDSNINNNQANGNGGGINAGFLELRESIVSGNTANGNGGGIHRPEGTSYDLTVAGVYDSTIENNSAGGSGGGLSEVGFIENTTVRNNSSSIGGGLFITEAGIILGSTFNNNESTNIGGGIVVGGDNSEDVKVAIANTTISGNSTAGSGGGIVVFGSFFQDSPDNSNENGYSSERITRSGEVIATNVTITNNLADSDNDGIGDGGGVLTNSFTEGTENPTVGDRDRFDVGKISFSNSIVAGNFDTPDNSGTGEINPDLSGAARGNANNLIGNTEGIIINADLVATETESLGQGSDLVNPDPGLGELQDNGGLTQTHSLLSDSIAIDAGNNEGILQERFVDLDDEGTPTSLDFNGDGIIEGGIPYDQRGGEFDRIVNGTVDIGAFELNSNFDDINSPVSNNVYRFFNRDTGVHFYTANETEKDAVLELPNYNFEGSSYKSIDPLTGNPEPMPVYRFLNQDTGVHLYTISEVERDATEELNNFSFEGEAFFAYESEVEGSIPIYRFFNSLTGAHFYTPSTGERDNVEANLPDFQSEGIAYYALPFSE
ncbi:hypothetical protein I4641_15725 [Waterburya agarophytonicola K14]|uniref:DUF5648 domain-containing protein n=1 Tax=Waterburya agarophytonicola KI4 TaxID=2874699 RepID=A0A964BUG4_9CYAN|nr:choice-of-anchor Q domain-containing protein [Waterburya agarophytonicola]MCC0178426.1 hypothetical protein [Waterburya agarophytonicola KI4]